MADSTLVALGSIAERRWGLFTTAQAETAGVARKKLSRMASAGAIERVTHGVYRMAGAPTQEHEALYATWLALGGATNPRTASGVAAIVAAGTTAAVVHNIGDFLLARYDFIVPSRKGTRLPGVRLRIRDLTRGEVIPVNGLPTLTVERTIADLVDLGTDLSLIADAVRAAVRADKLVAPERLIDFLSPIATRRKTTGHALAADLFELAGVHPKDGTMAENDEGYGDWRSLELAMKDAAKKAAAQADPRVKAAQVNSQIKQARFDRFLSRVFAEADDSEWLLKGGVSMLARVPRSRTTKDVDLASLHAADLAEAERALSGLVSIDLGDHLTFQLIRSTPTGQGENQPGVATQRLVYACIETTDDIQVDTITVDVVVGPAPVGRVEVVEPANRLHLRRPLITYPYRLYPVVDQIADKVCATVDTNYPGGKRSSRVKDLVDLVVLAHTQHVELIELRAAIEAKRLLSGLPAFAHVDIPENWHRTYPATAEGVPTAEPYATAEAAELVARFVDPALTKGSDAATWEPENLSWSPTPSVPRAYPAT